MGNKLTVLLQTWDEIHRDIKQVLRAQAEVDRRGDSDLQSIDAMIQACLPALCQRLCELGARIGETEGDTSASVMICHYNDTENGRLYLRVYESFPNYGLDRTINFRDGRWNLHLREVDYKNPKNPSINNEVVARALIKGTDLLEEVPLSTNTESENRLNIMLVQSILPKQIHSIHDLEQIRPGTVVCLNVDFYNTESYAPNSWLQTIERGLVIKGLLSEIHEISLMTTMPEERRKSGIKRLLQQIKVGSLVNYSLQQLAKQTIEAGFNGGGTPLPS